ncbi:MAG: AraC family transcriptional regulator [Pseudomonadota bacterium]
MHKAIRHTPVLEGLEAVSITSDRSFPRHTHDTFGIGYIERGGQESWSGRGLVEAGAGDVITVNPGEIQDGLALGGKVRTWHMVYLTPGAVARFSDDDSARDEFTAPVVRHWAIARTVTEALTATMATAPEIDRIHETLMLALSAMKGAQVAPGHTQERSAGVERMLAAIHDQWAEALSLDTMAKAAGMSRFQALRRFTAEVGMTPNAYLTQKRVNAARRMILNGNALADTAIACGFSDQSHMTRTFARQFSVTPGKYRA